MTIAANPVVTRTNTNGVTHTFSFGYPWLDPAELKVWLVTIADGTIALQTKDTHYSVSNVGNEHLVGGTITFINELSVATAPITGKVVVILRVPVLEQDFNPSLEKYYPVAAGETALDRIYQVLQLMDWRDTRSIRLNDAYAAADLVLPDVAARVGKVVGFDSDGDLQLYTSPDDIAAAAAASEAAAAAYAAAAAISASTAETMANSATAANAGALIAQGAAEAAQAAAEQAETNAETAETNAETAASTATSEAGNASASALLAQAWAVKTDGDVESTDYSSKAWAIGGTGVTDTATRGAAKEWATKAENSTVDGTGYSALHYAAKAATSRSAAEAAQGIAEAAAISASGSESNAASSASAALTSANNAATAETNAETAETNAENAQAYAEEWAINPEDDPVSVAAGGDNSTTYSSLHWAKKAEAFAASIDPDNLVAKALFDAHTILAATSDNTPAALTVGEATIVGRATGGNIAALSASQVRTIINVEDGATADMSAAEILAALLTVDGTGSGLDADLLDGNSVAAFTMAATLAGTGNGQGASLVGIEDAGGLLTATTVEAALAELAADVAALDQAVVLKGTWDASGGSFPGSGAAQAGWSYIVSVGGTVNGVAFVANDRILAITDNASTSTYAANWHKLDYTDQVLSVDGATGAVSLSGTYQGLDGTLTAFAGLTITQGGIVYGTGADAFAVLAKDTNATRYLANTGSSNNPAWAQINLANGVTGDLPFANLAQGSALSVLGVTGNSTADVASIAAASDHQVMRRSGTAVAFGAVALNQSNAVTGQLVSTSMPALTGAVATAGGTLSTTSTGGVAFVIDGAGSTITTGIKGDVRFPFAATITGWTINGDQSGSIVIDLWKAAFSTSTPPADGNSITSAAPPTVTTAVAATSTALTGWTTSVSAGDVIRFNVDSVTSMQRVSITLHFTKTG